MRIAYGIHGYARGHASRALGILPKLSNHDILLIAGGDAYTLLSLAGFNVQEIPTFRYIYREGSSKYSKASTIWDNFPLLCDLFFSGSSYDIISGTLQDFKPDLVISDSEPWSQRVANEQKVPLLSFDHYGMYAYCEWDMPAHNRLQKALACSVYKAYMGNPDKIIVSSFYPATPKDNRISTVGPIVRPAVKRATPTPGNHLLAYLNNGLSRFVGELESCLMESGHEVLVYGTGKTGKLGNITFLPVDPLRFVEDLASCRAVISSAGNQLIGETIWLGKPVLAIPEDSIDQRLNALGITNMEVGMTSHADEITPATLTHFLSNEATYKENCEKYARDSSPVVISLVNRFLQEIEGR
jgi:uncharacterized protein (TIGR00661 family)